MSPYITPSYITKPPLVQEQAAMKLQTMELQDQMEVSLNAQGQAIGHESLIALWRGGPGTPHNNAVESDIAEGGILQNAAQPV